MKLQLSMLLVAGTMLLFSCQKEGISAPETEVSKANPNRMNEFKVPFKGTYTTSVQILSSPPALLHRISGTGNATHLGASEFVATATVYLTPPPPFLIVGTVIFTAANGDQLFASYTGTSMPVAGAPNNVLLTYTVTGGTGRFENATGSFTGVPVVPVGALTGTITLEGNISY
jgi:hypothetical protein